VCRIEEEEDIDLNQKKSVTIQNIEIEPGCQKTLRSQCWPPKHKLLKLTEHANRFYRKKTKKQIKDKYA